MITPRPKLDIPAIFANFVVMENGSVSNGNSQNLLILEKKAVKAALNQDWKTAIPTNLEILELKPKNRDAKMRLGMAYLQTKNFKKAESVYKEVLKDDPINSIARKNLELAKQKKAVKSANGGDTKHLIKEPGTAEVGMIELASKKLIADDFELREELEMKINRASVSIQKNGRTIGKLRQPDLVKRLNKGKRQRAELTAVFFGGHDKFIKILFKSDIPIFKAERQEFKPYVKKGAIDEPEMEMFSEEETIE
ncbi:hypothetical protein A2886_02245 [candidate division WWE3 bacterium RIFCSPHIGHO2_01_FULL_42_13]|uniref:Uncharacterized protein n=1 Tax=candidate division WWE3 bacterium RIFCSPHIGHO2_01_FULL_42_13 TaxID=1802617 RepID=A0A1F4URP9_UNCKA|nr:MAG: hypothetical protein A2886_02245 [candidate division WWE3 bacterium RIFCSPHIGHO2_01_FULL_42_13]